MRCFRFQHKDRDFDWETWEFGSGSQWRKKCILRNNKHSFFLARYSPGVSLLMEYYVISYWSIDVAGSWPWITALGYTNSRNPYVPRWLCGGALISSRHVLTAGHCVYGRNDLYKVRIGDLDLNDDYDGATPFEDFIERRIIHPDYNPTTYTNDVAILKTSQDVPFTCENLLFVRN